MLSLPDRDELHAEFQQAVQELLDKNLTNPNLDKGWHSTIGDSIFDACYNAVEDFCHPDANKGLPGTPYAPTQLARMHVVSAPVGSGKTSFSIAFIAALVRYCDHNPLGPYGCLFVADQMQRADQIYRDLSAIIPGKVGIWTTEHDRGCKTPAKVLEPAAVHTKDELKDYPVAVVTHNFFSGKGNHKAKYVTHAGHEVRRALTVIDEHIEEVPIFGVEASDAQYVLELMRRDEDTWEAYRSHIETLVEFMHQQDKAAGGTIETPSTHPEAWKVADSLQWFTRPQADAYLRGHTNDERLQRVFGFAKALARGYAFINRQQGVHFIGYASNIVAAPGTVLLDATSDIDGVRQLCPWRQHQEVPLADYSNLHVVHVPPPHKAKNLTTYLKSAKRKREYVDHVVATIKQHMKPGQKGLVVVKQLLIDDEYVPSWPVGDPNHRNHKLFTENWGWDINGRKLCAVHWGTGIGQNKWKDADVVFLFDDYVLPRRVVIAKAQGLSNHKSTEGDLGSMKAHNSKAPAVDRLQLGHQFRWMKQMALRGKGRNYNESGQCDPQKLVYSGNERQFLTMAEDLFPGAKVEVVNDDHPKQTQAEAFLALLRRSDLPQKLTQSWLTQQLGRPWRELSKHLMKSDEVLKQLAKRGWNYVAGRGRQGSYFEQTQLTTPSFVA
jgi:hypothetical protein